MSKVAANVSSAGECAAFCRLTSQPEVCNMFHLETNGSGNCFLGRMNTNDQYSVLPCESQMVDIYLYTGEFIYNFLGRILELKITAAAIDFIREYRYYSLLLFLASRHSLLQIYDYADMSGPDWSSKIFRTVQVDDLIQCQVHFELDGQPADLYVYDPPDCHIGAWNMVDAQYMTSTETKNVAYIPGNTYLQR